MPITETKIFIGGPRNTENILVGGPRATAGHRKYPVYWKNFTSGLSFTVSILGQHLLRLQADIKEDHTIARPVCLLKRARVGALSEGNMVEATYVMRKVQPFRVDCALCRIKQMLVLKNG